MIDTRAGLFGQVDAFGFLLPSTVAFLLLFAVLVGNDSSGLFSLRFTFHARAMCHRTFLSARVMGLRRGGWSSPMSTIRFFPSLV